MRIIRKYLTLCAAISALVASTANAQEVKPTPKLSMAVTVGLYASFAGDAMTSHYNLTHGGTEAVIPSQNPRVVSAVIAGEAVALHWALKHVSKTNPKSAKWMGVAFILSRVAVVSWNYSQIRKLR